MGGRPAEDHQIDFAIPGTIVGIKFRNTPITLGKNDKRHMLISAQNDKSCGFAVKFRAQIIVMMRETKIKTGHVSIVFCHT